MFLKMCFMVPFWCVLPVLVAQIPERKDMKIILFLIKGCRWDYINDPHLKGIPRMIKNGVRAPYVTPIYPANSYPNWYSIVTGLYAESHGFVGSEMYDEERNEFFLKYPDESSTKPFWWNEAEPIWITAEKYELHSALYWWAGCEIEIKEMLPVICEVYRCDSGIEEQKNNILSKVDDVLRMFKLGELDLVQIYYDPIDINGHNFGPNTPARRQSLYAIDDVIDTVQEKIEREGLENKVNILVVSDHGMTEYREENTTYIDLEPFAHKIKYQVSHGSASMILPKPGMLDELYLELKRSFTNGVQIYKKGEIPDKYHFKNSERILPLLLQAKRGYLIKPLNNLRKIKTSSKEVSPGIHGYDPFEVEDMRTVFFARGPAFKRGFTSDPLSNVDHYNLLCHILGIVSLPNNGSWEKIKKMLKFQEQISENSFTILRVEDVYKVFIIGMILYRVLT